MGKYYTDERLRELVEQYKPVEESKRPTEGMRTFLRGYALAVEELTGIPGDNGKYLGEDGDVYLWLHPKSLEISDAISDDIDERFAAIEAENANLRERVAHLEQVARDATAELCHHYATEHHEWPDASWEWWEHVRDVPGIEVDG